MDDELNPIKEQGGYKELDVTNLNAYCYGTSADSGLLDNARIRCVKKNVYARITSQSTSYTSDDYVLEIAPIVIEKIQ